MKKYMDTRQAIELSKQDAALVFRGDGSLGIHAPEPEVSSSNATMAAIIVSALGLRLVKDPQFLQEVLKDFFTDPLILERLARKATRPSP